MVCCEFEFDVFCICDVIELTTALECQKQLLMSSISNLGRRESLEIAVNVEYSTKNFTKHIFSMHIVATESCCF